MRQLRAGLMRFAALFTKQRRDQELADEISSHLEMHIADNLRRGMTPEEARRDALLKLGGIERTKEIYRDRRGLPVLETLLQDLRYGARMLRKNPGFTAVAILTLALGVGATTAVFSVVNAVLLEPLPYPDADRLVMVWEKVRLPNYQNDENDPTPGDFGDWRSRNDVFEDMAAIRYRSFNLTGAGEPVAVVGDGVTSNLFSVLQVRAALGRVFSAAEDQPGVHAAVISYGLWASRFGSNPQILGQSILLDGQGYTVVGVMPPGFHFPDADDELWVPLALAPADLNNRGSHDLPIVARLKPQVTLAQANAQMDTIARQLAEQYPATNTGETVKLVPLRDHLAGRVGPALLVLLCAVGLVLLIVCANLSSLLLARASARRREIAVRIALGAGSMRIVRQLLTESVLLALVGGAMGLLLAHAGVRALKLLSPADLPRVSEIRVDGPVLAFSLGISLLAGLIFGMAPALQASRGSVHDALKSGGSASGSGRPFEARKVLVIAETALGVIVIAGAGLLLRSFLLLERAPLGFHPESILTLRVIPRGEKYSQLAQRTAFYQQALERIEALPGVRSAAAITFLPLTLVRGSKGFSIEGRVPLAPGELPMADYHVVTPGYFRTMRISLLEGRELSWSDTPQTQPVILINQAMARRYWPNQDPVGQRIKQGLPESPDPWLTVVGVVGNVRQYDVPTEARPAVYFPTSQFENPRGILRDWVVRVSGDPLTLASTVRSAIWAVDGNLAISRVRTMEQVRSASVAPQRFNLLLFGLFACLALILAIVGLYGVTAYSVTRRIREIGIRMALGADRRDVLRLVMGEGMALALGGVAIGVVAALGLTCLMRGLLYGVGANDPLTFAGVAAVLIGVAVLACYVPARRATRVDPMVALRDE